MGRPPLVWTLDQCAAWWETRRPPPPVRLVGSGISSEFSAIPRDDLEQAARELAKHGLFPDTAGLYRAADVMAALPRKRGRPKARRAEACRTSHRSEPKPDDIEALATHMFLHEPSERVELKTAARSAERVLPSRKVVAEWVSQQSGRPPGSAREPARSSAFRAVLDGAFDRFAEIASEEWYDRGEDEDRTDEERDQQYDRALARFRRWGRHFGLLTKWRREQDANTVANLDALDEAEMRAIVALLEAGNQRLPGEALPALHWKGIVRRVHRHGPTYKIADVVWAQRAELLARMQAG